MDGCQRVAVTELWVRFPLIYPVKCRIQREFNKKDFQTYGDIRLQLKIYMRI